MYRFRVKITMTWNNRVYVFGAENTSDAELLKMDLEDCHPSATFKIE